MKKMKFKLEKTFNFAEYEKYFNGSIYFHE